MTVESESRAWLALIPLAATAAFYVLPADMQAVTFVPFLPQIAAYLCLAGWAIAHPDWPRRLGLQPFAIARAVRAGVLTGIVLGAVNVAVMLWLVPRLGWDIEFLRDTPHARWPAWFMVPWFIVAIAVLVELNFRGFLLGRLAAMLPARLGTSAAVLVSALLFSFDPFMTMTFRHLHWIALWDGIVWGALRVRLGLLSVPIVAHAVEVIVMYSVLKFVFAAGGA